MAHNDKKSLDKAIEAFTHAIEDRKDIHKAKFQRGKAYFEKGEMTKAKKDLEEYAKSAGSDEGFNKGMANKYLLDIAAKQI
jgi:Tfp pilus assembly protein PilF